jgi:type I protein arginine methyltransferase
MTPFCVRRTCSLIILPRLIIAVCVEFDSSKDWSDSDDDDVAHEPSNLQAALHRIKNLEKRLLQAKQELSDYRTFVGEQLNITGLSQAIAEETISSQSATAAARDDDSHYFQSYGENEIHAIMIQDSVRTSTYASYILRNPQLFRDAVVLDVGCGTGILSLFAARAGAKRVFAVDASPVVEKAELIVKANELEDIITYAKVKYAWIGTDLNQRSQRHPRQDRRYYTPIS